MIGCPRGGRVVFGLRKDQDMDEEKEKLSIEEQLSRVSARQSANEKKETSGEESIEDEISKALGSFHLDEDIPVSPRIEPGSDADPENAPTEPEEEQPPEEEQFPEEKQFPEEGQTSEDSDGAEEAEEVGTSKEAELSWIEDPEAETESPKPTSEKKARKQKGEKKKGGAKKAIGIVALILLVALAVAYGAGAYYYSSHFYRQTTINGIDFSNKTAEEVQEKLTEEVSTYVLTLQERENMTETIDGKTIDLQLTFDNDFTQMIKEQSAFAWPKCLFAKSSYEVGSAVSYDEEKLSGALELLKACDEVTMITPIDASVGWNETEQKYVIDPGVAGTKLNKEAFAAAVSDAVYTLQKTLVLEETDCYAPQNMTEDDERLVKATEALNRAATAVITYEINGTQEVCDGSVIHTWLSLDENYEMQVNAELARAWIDTLGDKYNTYGTTRSFTTHDGSTVSITQGDYGWRMNRADTTEELVAAVREGGSQQKEILWLQTANAFGADDWGSTYVEVDMTNQHVYFYKNGELIVDSDCVTGKMTSERMTPAGIYSLKYKEKDRTLRGQQQADGSYEYESFVNFWMPFNGGVGMHDATWRSSFGGSIYINSGSHGCVNLPYSKAKAIYENIETGTPIICYYRSSSTTSTQTEEEETASEAEATAEPQTEATAEPQEETAAEPQEETTAEPQAEATPEPAAESADSTADQSTDQSTDQTSEAEGGQNE